MFPNSATKSAKVATVIGTNARPWGAVPITAAGTPEGPATVGPERSISFCRNARTLKGKFSHL